MIKDYQFFKEKINYAIQNSGLDIGAVYFIFKDIFSDLERDYFIQINKELAKESEENKSEKEENIISKDSSEKC